MIDLSEVADEKIKGWSNEAFNHLLPQEIKKNPWLDEIVTYLDRFVYPIVNNRIQVIANEIKPGINVKIKWIWEEPWNVETKSISTIWPNAIKFGQPKTIIGGRGYWQLIINDIPMDYLIISVWDHIGNYLIINFNEDIFKDLVEGKKVELKKMEVDEYPSYEPPPEIAFNDEALRLRKIKKNQEEQIKEENKESYEELIDVLRSLEIKPDKEKVKEIINNYGDQGIEECVKQYFKEKGE